MYTVYSESWAAENHVTLLSALLNRQYFRFGSQAPPGWSWTYRPDWSPDGSQISFECYYDPCYDDPNGHSENSEIQKVNANGTGDPLRLTNNSATDT